MSYIKVVGNCFIGLLFSCLDGEEGIDCDVEEESKDIWDNAISDVEKKLKLLYF